MKRTATIIAVALHIALAGIIYAATTNPDLPPQDTLIKWADYPAQNAQMQIWQHCADIAIDGRPYHICGTAKTDVYGAVMLLESPTGNAVAIMPDGSADVHLDGTTYQFEIEF